MVPDGCLGKEFVFFRDTVPKRVPILWSVALHVDYILVALSALSESKRQEYMKLGGNGGADVQEGSAREGIG